MKRKLLLWLIGLPVLAGLVYIIISLWISSHQLSVKRTATASAKITAFAQQQATKTMLALTPTLVPLDDLATACNTGQNYPVYIEGIIKPSFIVQSKTGNESFTETSFYIVDESGLAYLESVQVCRDKHFKSCMRMPKPGFSAEEISGYTSDGVQFVYADVVKVSGTVRAALNDQGNPYCFIKVVSIDP